MSPFPVGQTDLVQNLLEKINQSQKTQTVFNQSRF